MVCHAQTIQTIHLLDMDFYHYVFNVLIVTSNAEIWNEFRGEKQVIFVNFVRTERKKKENIKLRSFCHKDAYIHTLKC